MNNLFNSIQLFKPKNNVFDLSHDVKLSFNMGQLVPIMCVECVPGDKFNISCESLLRFAPLVSPVMHRMDVTMHYFFVPYRLLWPHWEDFITNTKDSGNQVPAFPTVNMGFSPVTTYTELADYLGIPTPHVPADSINEAVSALPFAAYQKIYSEYYRDQNLVIDTFEPLADGDNTADHATLCKLQYRAWEHDYFTSGLPFAQKGAEVDIPVGTVILDPTNDNPWTVRESAFNIPITSPHNPANGALTGAIPTGELTTAGLTASQLDPEGSLVVEGTTINTLRRAFKLQEWLEKNARGGTRYIENILSHFGVRSSDKRLQRPEYITGTKSPVVISEIANTTGLTGQLPQGNLAGHGISVTAGKYGSYRCEEHGVIMGIMSCLPKTAYQQGINKMWLKRANTDFFWPSFAHLGEQPIENRELFAYEATGGSDTFAYIPRYAEYKYEPSRVAGQFRTTLDFWHLGRIFSTAPALNQTFIECKPDTRIFAVEDPTVNKLYCHVYNKIKAVRPMPKFGTPTF